MTLDLTRRTYTDADVQKLLCGKAAIDALITAREAEDSRLAALDLVSLVESYGYTEAEFKQATQLSFDAVEDIDDINLQAIGEQLLKDKYQDKNASGTVTASGYESTRFKAAALQAGLTKKII